MSLLDRLIAPIAPGVAARRARARLEVASLTRALAHYDAATTGRRGAPFRAVSSDGDAAARRRDRIAYVSRDLVRNNPFAARAQSVVAGNVVGDGIIPKLSRSASQPVLANDPLLMRGLDLIETHLDTSAIDNEGRGNLYALQRLIMMTVFGSGEALVVRSIGRPDPVSGLDLKIKVLEPDFLNTSLIGMADNGNYLHEGIEYDKSGRRVAYHLYDRHPGSDNLRGNWRGLESDRVSAEDVLHIYVQDRPGQMRGVPWMAPVALALGDFGDYNDAQLMRQKVAACFAAFHKVSDFNAYNLPKTDGQPDDERAGLGDTLEPGLIQRMGMDEEIVFADPPEVSGYDDFTRQVLRSVAAGLGITYEALSGDLGQVNFSSARMGRMEMDRNVSAWQWLLMINQFAQPFARWFKESWARADPAQASEIMRLRMDWVPPRRVLVDPTKEIPAMAKSVAAGFTSRREVVRSLGTDPEAVNADILADAAFEAANGLRFDTSVRADPEADDPAQDEGD